MNDSRDPGLSNLPLGMLEETTYPSATLQAQTGDVVVIYSDSLIEAPLGGGRLLGQEGLLEVVKSVEIEPAATFAPRMLAAVLARCELGTERLGDDVTVLVLRPNGRKEPAPFFERVWAGVRFVGMFARSLVGGPRAPWPELSRENILVRARASVRARIRRRRRAHLISARCCVSP
ncbi:MAG: PP2C family protein-serine/threonine phosphatase [Phycisphaerales bacterium]